MFRFLPREETFFDLFEEAARNIHAGSELLKEMMDEYKDPESQLKKITEIENKGDTITHEIVKRLNQTFITPIDREDIYALASAMDDVLDLIEGVADRMVIFKIKEPADPAQKLSNIIYSSTSEICKAISLLRGSKRFYDHCVELNRLENEADRVMRDGIAQLFEEEKDPIAVIKWKEIYEDLEEATDRCEDVANVLESIMLKHT